MQLRDKTILIISNEPWGDIWYSKHNWAYELSKQNMVYFINSPNRWKSINLFKTYIEVEDYSKSLKILNYNNRLPFTRFNFLFIINELLIYKSLNKFFHKHNNLIFWTFDPYRLINPKKMNLLTSIYFIADRYLIPKEKKLIRNVDYIFSVSQELTKNIKHEKILNLSHAISETEFKTTKLIDDNYILYIGGIDYRLDYQLIDKLLTEFPQENFLFIGKISPLKDKYFEKIFLKNTYKNLKYKSAIHFKELKNYISSAKLCLAPMKKGVQGNSINHHKLLQYLAFGKSVLSTKFNDYVNNDLLVEYSTMIEAIDKLNILLENDENKEQKQKRINFARQFSYSNLIKKIEKFL